jgi:tripartite-type tricarboxylate transporter receptor subunit TctC
LIRVIASVRGIAERGVAIMIAAALLVALSTPAPAWPDRAVTVVTPTGAGGGSDAVARILADRLGPRWNAPVIVANHPGADGILAVAQFLRERDALLFTMTGTVTVNPLIHAKLPYDPLRDLLPISFVVEDFIAVAGAPDLSANSLGDLVRLAKSRPGEITYAAVPGAPYLAGLDFQARAGIDLTFIPYRNPIASVADVLEDRMQVALLPLSVVLGPWRGGKLKLLVVLSDKRAPAAPDVPTAAESGYPDFTVLGGLGLFAPQKMPSALRARIADDVHAVLGEPAIGQRVADLGYVPRGTGPSDFATLLVEQNARWAAVARAHAMKPPQ